MLANPDLLLHLHSTQTIYSPQNCLNYLIELTKGQNTFFKCPGFIIVPNHTEIWSNYRCTQVSGRFKYFLRNSSQSFVLLV